MTQPHAIPPRRLRAVSVVNLFGVFTHPIELKDERITIIHGPNGFGKTAILRIISGFFERRYSMLRSVPFDTVTFHLDDETEIEVSHIAQQHTSTPKYQGLRIRSGTHHWDTEPFKTPRNLPLHYLDDQIPWLHRIDEETWFDHQSGEQLDTTEVLDRYKDFIPFKIPPEKTPEWLQRIQDSVHVYFIRANRLEAPTVPDPYRQGRAKPAQVTPAVASYAQELAQRIQQVQAEYAKLAQTLDRSFPVRIMSPDTSNPASLSDIKRQLGELDVRRKDLHEAGLLEQTSQEVEKLPEPSEPQLGVLSVYINDMRQKLDVFSDLRQRIELFRELLNSRFLFKRVQIDKKQGLVFQTRAGQELPPTSLSTGEQHEVIILYQLLFLTQASSLVLIDEPEISLHIAWQKPFIHDIHRISQLTNVDFVIATHSPQIIGNRWDLTVELYGPVA